MRKTLFIISIIIIAVSQAFAQKKEIKYNLNETGDQYIKFTFLNQTWVRFNESNPGTLVNGTLKDNTLDIGLRRTRMQLLGQISPRVFFYAQFGMNNFNYLSQTAGNRKIQAFFHDALAEYNVFENTNYLKLGGGLALINGLSRFTEPGIGSIMTLDVPVFAQATVDQTDQFGRKLSVYARGQVGKLDYRFALSDPFAIQTNGQPVPAPSANATFNPRGHSKQYQGFLIWNFLESEPHTTASMNGTYLGKKRIFNLEAGIITQPEATWSAIDADTNYHDMLLWSAALFLDTPIKADGSAINAYVGYFSTNYGPNYLRNNGIMNPANGTTANSLGGFGNSYPMFGTGNVIYSQAGYKFKDNLLGNQRTLMPYASLQLADYERLGDKVAVYDIGVNWLIAGHASKLSLDYQNRPVFTDNGLGKPQSTTRRSSVTLQYQVSF